MKHSDLGNEETFRTPSRQIWEEIESRKDYATWMAVQRRAYRWVEGVDYIRRRVQISGAPGRPRIDFHLSAGAEETLRTFYSAKNRRLLVDAGGVYVVSTRKGAIKVGSAQDPQSRLASLQTGSADILFLDYWFTNLNPCSCREKTTQMEKDVQSFLKDQGHHLHHEWFSDTALSSLFPFFEAHGWSRQDLLDT